MVIDQLAGQNLPAAVDDGVVENIVDRLHDQDLVASLAEEIDAGSDGRDNAGGKDHPVGTGKSMVFSLLPVLDRFEVCFSRVFVAEDAKADLFLHGG